MLAGTAVLGVASGTAQASFPGQPSAVLRIDCDRACLIGHVRQYMGALARQDPKAAPIAPNARFTENNVMIPGRQRGSGAR